MLDYDEQNNINNLAISCGECNTNRKVADFNEYRLYIQKKQENLPEGSRQKIVNTIDPQIKNIIIAQFVKGNTIAFIQSQFNLSKRTIIQILKSAGYNWVVIQQAKHAV